MSEVHMESVKSFIKEIKSSVLPQQDVEVNIANYMVTHMHLAQLYFSINDYKKTFYHLSECHGTVLRRYATFEALRREGCFGMPLSSASLNQEYLSLYSEYAKQEDEGLFRRLSEMPPEWTVVQLSRIPADKEYLISQDSNAQLKELFISRIQCGPAPDEILLDYTNLPNVQIDLIGVLNKAASQIASKGNNKCLIKLRKEAAKTIENLISTLDDDIFMDWKCLLLGELQDETLKIKIKDKINLILEKHHIDLPSRKKRLLHLIAVGVCFYNKPDVIKSSIKKNMPDNEVFKKELYNEIMSLSELFPELRTTKRHPVILIIEDHLDIVPWESMPILKDQAVTRIPSIHFLHALFKAHEKHIHRGLREISEGKINWYVVNPDSDLIRTETRLKAFFQTRLPSWQGIVGEKPPPSKMCELLSSSNTYIYCGHGSGGHLLSVSDVQQLNLNDSIQLIFGCRSAALNFLGGVVPMMGDMLHYCIAGSPCSVGMLYTVLSDDADTMTTHLTNIWLPGIPIDSETLKPIAAGESLREAELLRVLPNVRKVAKLPSNGLALISRGLPVKLVTSSE